MSTEIINIVPVEMDYINLFQARSGLQDPRFDVPVLSFSPLLPLSVFTFVQRQQYVCRYELCYISSFYQLHWVSRKNHFLSEYDAVQSKDDLDNSVYKWGYTCFGETCFEKCGASERKLISDYFRMDCLKCNGQICGLNPSTNNLN